MNKVCESLVYSLPVISEAREIYLLSKFSNDNPQENVDILPTMVAFLICAEGLPIVMNMVMPEWGIWGYSAARVITGVALGCRERIDFFKKSFKK